MVINKLNKSEELILKYVRFAKENDMPVIHLLRTSRGGEIVTGGMMEDIEIALPEFACIHQIEEDSDIGLLYEYKYEHNIDTIILNVFKDQDNQPLIKELFDKDGYIELTESKFKK